MEELGNGDIERQEIEATDRHFQIYFIERPLYTEYKIPIPPFSLGPACAGEANRSVITTPSNWNS